MLVIFMLFVVFFEVFENFIFEVFMCDLEICNLKDRVGMLIILRFSGFLYFSLFFVFYIVWV